MQNVYFMIYINVFLVMPFAPPSTASKKKLLHKKLVTKFLYAFFMPSFHQ